jgi:hypothetical protein
VSHVCGMGSGVADGWDYEAAKLKAEGLVRREEELLGRLDAALREFYWWQDQVADMEEHRDRLVVRVLREIGITPRQRKVIDARPRLSGRSLDRQSRDAIRRRQVWVHKRGKVLAVEELWGDRIDASRQDKAAARDHLASAVREALDLWPDPAIFERRTGFTRQELSLVARKPRGATGKTVGKADRSSGVPSRSGSP